MRYSFGILILFLYLWEKNENPTRKKRNQKQSIERLKRRRENSLFPGGFLEFFSAFEGEFFMV